MICSVILNLIWSLCFYKLFWDPLIKYFDSATCVNRWALNLKCILFRTILRYSIAIKIKYLIYAENNYILHHFVFLNINCLNYKTNIFCIYRKGPANGQPSLPLNMEFLFHLLVNQFLKDLFCFKLFSLSNNLF